MSHSTPGTNGNRRARKTRARRRGREVGVGMAAAIAVGLTPLASGPPARADVFDDTVDEVLSALTTAATGTVDADAFAAPSVSEAAFAGLNGLPDMGGAGGSDGLLGSHATISDFDTATASNTPPPTGTSVLPLSSAGGWLTNSDGQVVVLHGVNEVVKAAPYEPSATGFGADDAAFLATNGVDSVRLGLDWAAVEPEPGVFNDAYLASIAQTVQTLQSHGIYVILDMHQDLYSATFGGEGAPAWATDTGGLPNTEEGFPYSYFFDPAENHAWDAFWANAPGPNGVGLETDYVQMWQHVANYFNSIPSIKSDIAGFEIMNEPWPGSQWLTTAAGSPIFGLTQLAPFYNQVDSAIRTVDATTPVFFEPNFLAGEGLSPINVGPVNDPNTVFSFHDYCAPEEFGSTLGCGLFADEAALNAKAYATLHHIPAVMTEFGATSNTTAIADEMQAADQNQMSWLEWAFTGQGDITTTGSSSSEGLVDNPALPPTGTNVNTAMLQTLAEPYPQVVSGTPNSYSFSDGTFNFSYSTEMASGLGSFPAGSQTDIATPAVEYPNGYQVDVTGGHVVSAPNASELVIASDPGARTVTVTVSPTSGGGAG